MICSDRSVGLASALASAGPDPGSSIRRSFAGSGIGPPANVRHLAVILSSSCALIDTRDDPEKSWRWLKRMFPDHIKSHTRRQTSCFGQDTLLRRHDCTSDIVDRATLMLYATGYGDVNGIMIPPCLSRPGRP